MKGPSDIFWIDFKAVQTVRPHLLAKRRRNPKRRKRNGNPLPHFLYRFYISPAVRNYLAILNLTLFVPGRYLKTKMTGLCF